MEGALKPYIGLHDKLLARPCGAAAWAPTGRVQVRSAADLAPVGAALLRQAQRLQQRLQIGQVGRAWDIRDAVGDQQAEPALSAVVNFVETLTDFVPAKSALISVDFSGLTVEVAP